MFPENGSRNYLCTVGIERMYNEGTVFMKPEGVFQDVVQFPTFRFRGSVLGVGVSTDSMLGVRCWVLILKALECYVVFYFESW